jgi:hypothetical protein
VPRSIRLWSSPSQVDYPVRCSNLAVRDRVPTLCPSKQLPHELDNADSSDARRECHVKPWRGIAYRQKRRYVSRVAGRQPKVHWCLARLMDENKAEEASTAKVG